MAAIPVKVHPQSTIEWGTMSELVGVLKMKAQVLGEGNGQQQDIALHGLAFVDPDGETHVYVFTEDGRQALLAKLTGGIVVPG